VFFIVVAYATKTVAYELLHMCCICNKKLTLHP